MMTSEASSAKYASCSRRWQSPSVSDINVDDGPFIHLVSYMSALSVAAVTNNSCGSASEASWYIPNTEKS